VTLTQPSPTVETRPLGTITTEGDSATLNFVRHLPCPVDAVWAALVEPSRRAAWFGTTTLDPRAGGPIEMDPDDPPAPRDLKHMSGRILVWEPLRVFEHEWMQTIVGKGAVRYELATDGEGTALTFTHRGLSVPNAMGFIPGTHAYFDRLEAYLAGQEIPGWNARFAALQPLYAAAQPSR
jgi:uncharacterized protein YndB with AHSA1/START domain